MSDFETREIAYDCRFFLGDRPCIWHKRENKSCVCDHYVPLSGSMLIIKLDAMGDVLRTTSILPAIDKAYPNTRITWITRPESVPLLERNPYVAEVVPYGPDAILHLTSRKFGKVVNLDAGKISAGMASIADGNEKIGYVLHEDGYVVGTNAAAEVWQRMGVFDDIKRANTMSYQERMCAILGLPMDDTGYVLELAAEEKDAARTHLGALGLDLAKPVVGIHTGGGVRWELKQWTEDRFIASIRRMSDNLGDGVQMLLLGGELERAQNQRIVENVGVSVFDTGCDNTVRHFAALVNECAVIISGDTLAMHIALATRRRVVVLFGPTSHTEIELFGLGEKVIPDLDCLCCYKTTCDFKPNCMESISVDMVNEATYRQLNVLRVAA